MKYAAFISYSHRDQGWASWLHRSLETYRFPKSLIGSAGRDGSVPGRLGVLFRDRDELPTSSDLGTAIVEALDASRYLVVICSPHAAASRWVNEEVLHFKRTGRENRILPVIIGGEPNGSDKGQPEDECFPPALRFKLGGDGVLSDTPTEFVAADARRLADGRANAKLKLLAGLVGTDYDNLKQRERRRAQKKRTHLIAGGVMLATLLAVAGMISVTQSLRATAATSRASEQEARAEQAEREVATVAGVAEQLKERWSGTGGEFTPLIDAVLLNDVNTLEELALAEDELNAFWGSERLTPLMVAMAAGNAEATRWLMANGARPDVYRDQGDAAVHVAVDYNQPGALEAYAEGGGDLDQPSRSRGNGGWRAIDFAAGEGLVEVVRELLRLGVPTEVDASGNAYGSPLFVAAFFGHTDVVRLLVESGARTDLIDRLDRTPFDVASENGHLETARLLATEGSADPAVVESAALNASLHGSLTAMLIGTGSLSDVKALIKAGADPNAEDKYGVTAFARAVAYTSAAGRMDDPPSSREDWFEVMRVMLDHGADKYKPSTIGAITIRESLESPGDKELIELIFGDDVDR